MLFFYFKHNNKMLQFYIIVHIISCDIYLNLIIFVLKRKFLRLAFFVTALILPPKKCKTIIFPFYSMKKNMFVLHLILFFLQNVLNFIYVNYSNYV